MRGRGWARDGAEIEALVRARLHSIVAAASPRAGWVPDPVAGSADPEPSGATAVVDADPAPAEPADTHPTGRHRGEAGGNGRVRWDPGRPGATALCAVAVIAALMAAGLTWLSRPEPAAVDAVGAAPTPLAFATDGTGGEAGTAAERASVTPDGTAEPDHLVVSVIGQVHEPGLVTLASGARVADALTAAGGALPEADLSTVNLARLVVDGEQIAVGVPGSALPEGADTSDPSGTLINLNTATLAQLDELPGIGPVLAQRIIDFRLANGGFTAVEQLREVSGIGPVVYEDVVALVTV